MAIDEKRLKIKERSHIWAEEFIKAPRQTMNDEQVSIFMRCCLSEKDPDFPPEEVRKSFQWRMLESRLQHYNVNATNALKTFITCIADRPAIVTMWSVALVYMSIFKTHEDAQMDIDVLARTFPNGFPTAKALQELWDAQKGFNIDLDVDNLLDVAEF